jgi:predicted metal-dependent peptidase
MASIHIMLSHLQIVDMRNYKDSKKNIRNNAADVQILPQSPKPLSAAKKPSSTNSSKPPRK